MKIQRSLRLRRESTVSQHPSTSALAQEDL